jgi:hypothetical protein
MAETGQRVGAVQVAATDAFLQAPFFLAACDYTMFGEELYAASAYLSREPTMLGSLSGQDIGKAAIGITIMLGIVAASFAVFSGRPDGFTFMTGLLGR